MNLERIGKYEIKGEIGRGTMGTVYKAWDPVLKRHVAIKTMPATPGRNDESKQRFQREAQAAAVLAHPNIVTVHDLGEEQGLIFMAMELLEGRDLRDALAGEAPASPSTTLDEKLEVMEQIAAGLAFAHAKHVVHRDLKPANIHIQPNGQVKIVDFGLARLGGSDMTQTGVVLGTPNYMSPEQALGDKVDARTDVFSAGGVFYEMLTGHKPFDAETTPGVLYQVVHKEPVPIGKWMPDVPPIVVEVVERCLTKDKTARFQNGRQLRVALGWAQQAIAAGRGAASLAEESQRANEDVRKNESSQRLSPSGSRASLGRGQRRPGSARRPPRRDRARRPARPTLSGRSPTQTGRPPRRPPARRGRFVPDGHRVSWCWPRSGRLLATGPRPGPRSRRPLRRRRLTDCPRGGPHRRPGGLADRARGEEPRGQELAGGHRPGGEGTDLRPESGKARQILEQAKRRRGELEAAASQARKAFEAGNEQEASQALSHVLELDPKHPVVGELTARLNSTFRSRAEEAGRLDPACPRRRREGQGDRGRPVRPGGEPGGGGRDPLQEVRVRRRDPALPGSPRLLRSRAPQRGGRGEGAGTGAQHGSGRRSCRLGRRPGGPVRPPSRPPQPPRPPRPSLPARTFVTGKSVVGSARAGGGLTGFDGADVKTKKMPDLVGRLEFEVEPMAPRGRRPFLVRIYLTNEGKKAVRLRGSRLDHRRSTASARARSSTLREHDVPPQARFLVAEANLTWPAGATTWSLEAVASSDRDETCTSRLTWQ